ncbi:MAG TPA: cytochrome c oxidase subunit II [Sphingomicrobium sp.]|nr:cytochrome c oxidase subunit II [Sphingomicrobium sp.]
MRARLTIFAFLALTGCSSLPLSYLDSDAPIGGRIAQLGWGMLAISCAVVVIITALVIIASLGGGRDGAPGELAVRRDAGGMRWIYIGVGISSVVLAISAIWTLMTLRAVAEPSAKTAPLTIGIDAHQWWWEADYRPEDPADHFATANEIHIPIDVPVRIELRSSDVIHSFWVPKLAGKTDVIPGRVNSIWIEATKPGIYRGQCAEYCGAEHALMSFRIIAEPVSQYKNWQQAELAGASLNDAAAQRGYPVFAAHCGSCHAIRGTQSGGVYGPDLTDLGARRTLAAGVLQNNPNELAYWIRHAQEVKPGARMPDVEVPDNELQPLVTFLEQH